MFAPEELALRNPLPILPTPRIDHVPAANAPGATHTALTAAPVSNVAIAGNATRRLAAAIRPCPSSAATEEAEAVRLATVIITAVISLFVGMLFAFGGEPTPTAMPEATATVTETENRPAEESSEPKTKEQGLGLAKAKRKLRAVGLEVGDVDHRPSSKRKDTVLKQGVDKGTKLEPRSSVALVVAAPLPKVPSVVGKSEASAVRMIKSAGFKVKKTTQTRTTGKDGVVLSQSRLGGTRAKPDSVVRIVISNVQRSTDAGASRNSTPGYEPCLPPAFDYDCRGGSGNGPKHTGRVRVTGPDPYDLDRDGDGKACEWS
jgi:resuscitation-promoting factor RpfB